MRPGSRRGASSVWSVRWRRRAPTMRGPISFERSGPAVHANTAQILLPVEEVSSDADLWGIQEIGSTGGSRFGAMRYNGLTWGEGGRRVGTVATRNWGLDRASNTGATHSVG